MGSKISIEKRNIKGPIMNSNKSSGLGSFYERKGGGGTQIVLTE